MKKKYIMLSVLLLVMLILVISVYLPAKRAVKLNDLDTSKYYIIVKVQKSTISPWLAIGDNNGDYEIGRDVYLTGNYPQGYNYTVDFGGNTFVCYGQYDGTRDIGAGEHNTFGVNSWEIIYPVKREGSVFDSFLPKGYLCRYDME